MGVFPPCKSAENVLVDYGCGAGRVDLFFSAETGCRSVGIDYDEKLIRKAESNQKPELFTRVDSIQNLPLET